MYNTIIYIYIYTYMIYSIYIYIYVYTSYESHIRHILGSHVTESMAGSRSFLAVRAVRGWIGEVIVSRTGERNVKALNFYGISMGFL